MSSDIPEKSWAATRSAATQIVRSDCEFVPHIPPAHSGLRHHAQPHCFEQRKVLLIGTFPAAGERHLDQIVGVVSFEISRLDEDVANDRAPL